MTSDLSMADDSFIFEADDPLPVIATSCPKCRTIVFWNDAAWAARAAVMHATECGTEKVIIAELLPPLTADGQADALR